MTRFPQGDVSLLVLKLRSRDLGLHLNRGGFRYLPCPRRPSSMGLWLNFLLRVPSGGITGDTLTKVCFTISVWRIPEMSVEVGIVGEGLGIDELRGRIQIYWAWDSRLRLRGRPWVEFVGVLNQSGLSSLNPPHKRLILEGGYSLVRVCVRGIDIEKE